MKRLSLDHAGGWERSGEVLKSPLLPTGKPGGGGQPNRRALAPAQCWERAIHGDGDERQTRSADAAVMGAIHADRPLHSGGGKQNRPRRALLQEGSII